MNLNNNLIKILEKMNYDDEEREIIQYGLEQFFSILLDVVTFIICGILWKELFFTLLIFLGVFFLRPYAGGYHADTKFNCYLITTIMMNIAIWMKKKLILSNITLVGIWISTTIFIVIYAPVENPIHCLVKQEQKKYREKTKKILLYNAIMMLAGVCFRWQFLLKVIVWVQVITAIAMAAGLWKYNRFSEKRL